MPAFPFFQSESTDMNLGRNIVRYNSHILQKLPPLMGIFRQSPFLPETDGMHKKKYAVAAALSYSIN